MSVSVVRDFHSLWRERVLRGVFLLSLLVALLVAVYERHVVYPRFAELLVGATETTAIRFARHYQTLLSNITVDSQPEDVGAEFRQHALDSVGGAGVYKLRVFNGRGVIIFSSDPEEVGVINDKPYFREIIGQGQVFSKLVLKDAFTMEGRRSLLNVVETYVPLMENNRFQGALEVYLDVTRSKMALDRELWRSERNIMGLSLGWLLLVTLGLLMASRSMRQREVAEAALLESEAKFRGMAACAQEGIVMMDPDGTVSYWNPAATAIFGFSEAEAMGRDLHELVAPARFHEAMRRGMHRFLENGRGDFVGRTVEMVGQHKEGHEFPVELTIVAMPFDGSWRAMGTVRDITRRKEAEQRLKLGANVISHALEGIVVTNAAGTIELVNPAFTHLTGYAVEDVVGQNPRIFKSGRHDPEFYRQMWHDLITVGKWQGEVWNRRKNGMLYLAWLSISSIRDSRGDVSHYVGISTDITRRKALEEHLERLAFYDALTGIPNRMLFMDRLYQACKQAKRRSQQVAVLFLDLDLFKKVNDTFGHDVGDQLLEEVAQRLERMLREEDTVARLGGDEFAVLLSPVRGMVDVEPVCHKIITLLTTPFQIKGYTCHIGASIGVALYPDHGDEGELLLKRADEAMYAAKKGGRNRYVVFQEEDMGTAVVEATPPETEATPQGAG